MRAANLATDLREAMLAGMVGVRYEPVLASDTIRPVRFEARPQWRHPVGGSIDPTTIEVDQATCDIEAAAAAADALAAAGVRIALDNVDAHSRIGGVADLPACEVKLAPSFVRSAAAGDTTIVELASALTVAAQTLGVAVVATGVDDATSLESALRLGTVAVQGAAAGADVVAGDVAPQAGRAQPAPQRPNTHRGRERT